METKTRILVQLLLLSVGICLGMMLMRSCSKPKEILTEIVKTDTVTVVRVDTVIKYLPQPYKVVVKDTVEIEKEVVKGSIFTHEIKTYKDSTFKAQVSGINANLDYIEVYPKNIIQYIYKTEKVAEKQKKWELVLDVDYTYCNRQSALNVGGGINYTDKWRTYSARIGRDVITGYNFVQAGIEMPIIRW